MTVYENNIAFCFLDEATDDIGVNGKNHGAGNTGKLRTEQTKTSIHRRQERNVSFMLKFHSGPIDGRALTTKDPNYLLMHTSHSKLKLFKLNRLMD